MMCMVELKVEIGIKTRTTEILHTTECTIKFQVPGLVDSVPYQLVYLPRTE